MTKYMYLDITKSRKEIFNVSYIQIGKFEKFTFKQKNK